MEFRPSKLPFGDLCATSLPSLGRFGVTIDRFHEDARTGEPVGTRKYLDEVPVFRNDTEWPHQTSLREEVVARRKTAFKKRETF